MKGLLYKEFYMTIKYGKVMLVFLFLYICSPILFGNQLFLTLYSFIIGGSMLSVSLISNDEKSRWNVYWRTLPYSYAQIVSVKYIHSLIMLGATWLLALLVQAGCALSGGEQLGIDFPAFCAITLAIGLMIPALIFPALFRFGSEKGRLVYYGLVLGYCIVGMTVGSVIMKTSVGTAIHSVILKIPGVLTFVLPLFLSGLVFAVSWMLSIRLYKKADY